MENLISKMGRLIGESISDITYKNVGITKYYNRTTIKYKNLCNMRPIEEKDIDSIIDLDRTSKLNVKWTRDSVKHWLLSKDGIVKSYVRL